MARTFFLNANVLDGGNPGRKADVVVDGERISAVGDAGKPAQGDRVYDLAGRSLMPGMVAGHMHLTYHNLDVYDLMGSDMRYPAPYIGVAAAHNAMLTLKAGFTSGIGAGGTYNMDVVLKQLIADGLAKGPRIVACGKDFSITGHAAVDYKNELWKSGQDAIGEICNGPEEFRRSVRQEAKRGVEIIKIFVEGGHGIPTNVSRMAYDEIAATVDTAHLCGIRVRAHTYSRDMIKQCLRAGVDIIDHADQMDDEIIEEFVKKGSFVLPSLYHLTLMDGITHTVEDRERWFEYARTSLAKAVKAGVKLVTGDDFGTLQGPHGDNARELSVYTDVIGIPALEVIKWATVNGAAMMQRDDLGSIEKGKLADLLVIDGDPSKDIKILADKSKILMVMQGGVEMASQPGLLS
ncbi:MAG: amidohydrolase family protein [Caulobacterales bacterium]